MMNTDNWTPLYAVVFARFSAKWPQALVDNTTDGCRNEYPREPRQADKYQNFRTPCSLSLMTCLTGGPGGGGPDGGGGFCPSAMPQAPHDTLALRFLVWNRAALPDDGLVICFGPGIGSAPAGAGRLGPD